MTAPAKFQAMSPRTPFSFRNLYVGLVPGPFTSAWTQSRLGQVRSAGISSCTEQHTGLVGIADVEQHTYIHTYIQYIHGNPGKVYSKMHGVRLADVQKIADCWNRHA